MVKINPKSKIWFLTRIGKDIEWRIEKRKRICLQNLILSRSEREFFSKSRISRGEREFFLQNLDIREHLEKWKFNSPARDRKKWTISSRDFLEIENLVNAWHIVYIVYWIFIAVQLCDCQVAALGRQCWWLILTTCFNFTPLAAVRKNMLLIWGKNCATYENSHNYLPTQHILYFLGGKT